MNEEEPKIIESEELTEQEKIFYAGLFVKNCNEIFNKKENDGCLSISVYKSDIRAIQGLLNLYKKEKDMYKNTGKIVKNKRDGKVGVVLREFETGQIQVLEKIGDKGGKVINTHDNWKTLEVIEDE